MEKLKQCPVYGVPLTGGISTETKICPVCGKQFSWNREHVYKILVPGSWLAVPVCTWGCKRKAERQGITRKGIYDWNGIQEELRERRRGQ